MQFRKSMVGRFGRFDNSRGLHDSGFAVSMILLCKKFDRRIPLRTYAEYVSEATLDVVVFSEEPHESKTRTRVESRFRHDIGSLQSAWNSGMLG